MRNQLASKLALHIRSLQIATERAQMCPVKTITESRGVRPVSIKFNVYFGPFAPKKATRLNGEVEKGSSEISLGGAVTTFCHPQMPLKSRKFRNLQSSTGFALRACHERFERW